MAWNKYHAVKSLYNGVTYDSRMEMKYAMELDLRLKATQIKAWERQIRIPLVVNGIKVCVIVPDFKITHLDDSIEWVEIKGQRTAVFSLKLKLFKATYLKDHPEERYTLIEKT